MENRGVGQNLLGVGEAGLALGSGALSSAVRGIQGIGAGLGAQAGAIRMGHNPFDPNVWLGPATQAIQQGGTPVYEPRTEAGREVVAGIEKPMAALESLADLAGQKTMDVTGSPEAGATVYTIAMAAGRKPKKPDTTKPVIDIPKKDIRVLSAAEVGDRVSTRFPTAGKRTENPLETHLTIGLKEAMGDMKAFSHNVDLFRAYPGIKPLRPRSAVGRANHIIDHMKNNLLWLYDQVPEATRDRSKQWYVGANNVANRTSALMLERFGLDVPPRATAGVYAALSPQTDWYQNASLGNRVMAIYGEQNKGTNRPTYIDEEMYQTALRIYGKSADLLGDTQRLRQSGKPFFEMTSYEKSLFTRIFDESYNGREYRVLSPEGIFEGVVLTNKGVSRKVGWGSQVEITKAIDILESGGNLDIISGHLGKAHKVRNFFNNIAAPNASGKGVFDDDVTIDTHAVGASLIRAVSGKSEEVKNAFGGGVTGRGRNTKSSAISGVQGSYPIYAEAYRQAARERGVLPREMQSITWEAVRGLFPDSFKTKKNMENIDTIWRNHDAGKITLDVARQQVLELAGGINAPDWEVKP